MTEKRKRLTDDEVTRRTAEAAALLSGWTDNEAYATRFERISADFQADYAQAREDRERLAAEVRWCLEQMAHGLPEPSHQGSCGPEAGCDGSCMDLAHFARHLTDMRKLLAEVES